MKILIVLMTTDDGLFDLYSNNPFHFFVLML